MKKILLATAFVMMFGFIANAQGDSFFRNIYYDNYSNRGSINETESPALPSSPTLGGIDGNPSAPLGSGLLVLTALGAGYAVARKRK